MGMLEGALVGGLIGAIVGGLLVAGRALVRAAGGRGTDAAPLPPGPAPDWRAQARRVLLGLVWFVVLWFLARIVCGAIVGGIAGASPPPGETSVAAGQTAAISFFARYGFVVLLGAFAAAAAGTATGVLPGTKVVGRAPLAPAQARDGDWPPPPSGPGAA